MIRLMLAALGWIVGLLLWPPLLTAPIGLAVYVAIGREPISLENLAIASSAFALGCGVFYAWLRLHLAVDE